MAYPTEDDDRELQARGFDKNKSGYIRVVGRETHGISPTGGIARLRSMDAPSEDVVWSAWCIAKSDVREGDDWYALVVPFAEGCPTPTVAFVTAEIRGWRRG